MMLKKALMSLASGAVPCSKPSAMTFDGAVWLNASPEPMSEMSKSMLAAESVWVSFPEVSSR